MINSFDELLMFFDWTPVGIFFLKYLKEILFAYSKGNKRWNKNMAKHIFFFLKCYVEVKNVFGE